MPSEELAFAGLVVPLRRLREVALSACVHKKCWLKDLRGVSVDELMEQTEIVAEQMKGGGHG
jgi:hypothetical protein